MQVCGVCVVSECVCVCISVCSTVQRNNLVGGNFDEFFILNIDEENTDECPAPEYSN